jgi:DNA-binding HxlR family transcriptional regulator
METFTPQPVSATPEALTPHRFSDTPRNFEECKAAIVPVNEVLAQIGGKWTIYIIMALANGPQRFSELKRKIDGVSQKMLTFTLRDLEKDGFISRKVTPSIPPRVDYELTDMGVELREPLAILARWAHANNTRIAEARHRFAAREAEDKRLAW